MPELPTCWVLWSHTDGEMPRIELVTHLKIVAETQRNLLQGIWSGMKRFELEEHKIV